MLLMWEQQCLKALQNPSAESGARFMICSISTLPPPVHLAPFKADDLPDHPAVSTSPGPALPPPRDYLVQLVFLGGFQLAGAVVDALDVQPHAKHSF